MPGKNQKIRYIEVFQVQKKTENTKYIFHISHCNGREMLCNRQVTKLPIACAHSQCKRKTETKTKKKHSLVHKAKLTTSNAIYIYFQCSGDDMNCVLHNGGVPPNQQRKSPLVSHGMLQAQQQQPQHTVTTEKPMLANQYLSANIAAKPLLANPPPYQLTNQLSMNANAALFAQQQAQAQMIAQQNLLAHQQATAASVNPMSSFTFIPHSAASAMHHQSNSGLAVAQSPLLSHTHSHTHTNPHHLAQHMQNLASLAQQQPMQQNLVSNLMSRTAGYPSAGMQTAQSLQSQSLSTAGMSQSIPFTLPPGLQFATFSPSMSPYTNQMLLSQHHHSLAALQLKTQQAQHSHSQARTFVAPSHTHTLQQHQQHQHQQHQQHQAAALQQMSPMSAQMTNFQHLSMNANAAATSLMHSIKRSYESAFHQDPSTSLHHQKRPTQFTGTGIL